MTGAARTERGRLSLTPSLTAESQLVITWARAVLKDRPRRSAGASTVEWILLCVLAAAVAAVLGAVLIRMVVSTTNLIRTQ